MKPLTDMIYTRRHIVLFALLSILSVSCEKVTDDWSQEKEGIDLSIMMDDTYYVNTKADRNDRFYNEAILMKDSNGNEVIDVLFFRSDNDNAPLVKYYPGIRDNGHVYVPTSVGEIRTIFGSQTPGSTCYVLCIANYKVGVANKYEGKTTLGEIKDLAIPTADWSVFPQTSFVMTGGAQLSLIKANAPTPARGTINLQRIASRLTFTLSVADQVEVPSSDGSNNIIWTPGINAMTVYLVYAMKEATLSGNPVAVPSNAKSSEGTAKLYEYAPRLLANTGESVTRMRNNESVEVPLYQVTDGHPFYTYPVEWTTGTVTEPYLKLIIPWSANGRTKYYYYKIPLPNTRDDGSSLFAMERNNWYHIQIDVQVLGGEADQPTEITPYYAVADWSGALSTTTETTGAGDIIPAEVTGARYLNIPVTEYVMYNSEELTIPINSSHDIEIVGFSVKSNGTVYQDKNTTPAPYIGVDPRIYNPFTSSLLENPTNFDAENGLSWVGTVKAVKPNYSQVNPTATQIDASSWFTTVSRTDIVIHHDLNMNMSQPGYDVAPYTLRFRVRHHDDAYRNAYYSDITVEQRPAIIIEPQRNSDEGEIIRNGHTAEDGYVFVNTERQWPNYNSNRGNTNFNMYVITTSVLPTDGSSLASYYLGDPRSKTYTSYAGSGDAIGVEGGTRTLTWYYPANDDVVYDNYIAPSFRIASSFGASSTMTRQNAINRCARYQEDGYPAGRWRLPTVAEIKYMAQLTKDGLIPRLLGNTTNNNTSSYWCNSGYVSVANGTNTANPQENHSTSGEWNVRCVYDEWFWSVSKYDRVDRETAYWGDQKMSDVEMK